MDDSVDLSKELIQLAEGDVKIKSKTKPKAIYNEYQTVDEMAKQTVNLLSDSARRLIDSAKKDEKEVLDILVNKSYTPKRYVVEKKVDFLEEMRNHMNLF